MFVGAKLEEYFGWLMERVVSLCRVECVWLYELCGVVACGYMQSGELGCWIIGWSGLYKSDVYFVIVWLVCTRVRMMCNWLIARCGCECVDCAESMW